jgi:DNA-binding response OmpR family regulator
MRAARLLLVEDDVSLGETLCERLEKEGYVVRWVETQAGGIDAFGAENFDLIILDVGLPDGSGFDFARRVRQKKSTPFIFVTAMNTAEHRLEGYEIGAEEYIPKPFHLKELLLRVKHVLASHRSENLVRVADRWIDFAAMTIVRDGGQKEFLGVRDLQLLKLLIEASPRVVSRDEILNTVWGEDKFPSHRTVDNSIVRLRQALGMTGAAHIRSVRSVGYQWAEKFIEHGNE